MKDIDEFVAVEALLGLADFNAAAAAMSEEFQASIAGLEALGDLTIIYDMVVDLQADTDQQITEVFFESGAGSDVVSAVSI